MYKYTPVNLEKMKAKAESRSVRDVTQAAEKSPVMTLLSHTVRYSLPLLPVPSTTLSLSPSFRSVPPSSHPSHHPLSPSQPSTQVFAFPTATTMTETVQVVSGFPVHEPPLPASIHFKKDS